MSIVVEQLDKAFAGRSILHRLDLRVDAGEIVGIIGSNASGKSTLIQLLSGILRPDHGHITIAGVDIYTTRRGPNERSPLFTRRPSLIRR
jgi:ABC-type multidrug transport system ATPase subunit